jgi:hypothetical protein
MKLEISVSSFRARHRCRCEKIRKRNKVISDIFIHHIRQTMVRNYANLYAIPGAENRLIEQYYTHRHQIDVNGPSTISYIKPSPFSHKRQRTFSDEGIQSQANDACIACGWAAHITKQDWENAADCSIALHQALTQKLHNTVVSLDEDKWMFGEEDGPAL